MKGCAARLLPMLLMVLGLLPAMTAGAREAVAAPPPSPPLVAELSTQEVEITTGFTGADIIVFGSTERPIGEGEEGDGVLIVAQGPVQPMVVRRKINVLGFWINGPSALFPNVPGFYAIAGTEPAWRLLPEGVRQGAQLGLDALPLQAIGAQAPAFRAALLELKQEDRRWQENAAPVEVTGGRLFHARIPLPATVPTGDYQVEVLLVRDGRVAARQVLGLRVQRVGSAAWIAAVARDAPVLYGIGAVLLAALAGWLGSVLFRRS